MLHTVELCLYIWNNTLTMIAYIYISMFIYNYVIYMNAFFNMLDTVELLLHVWNNTLTMNAFLNMLDTVEL